MPWVKIGDTFAEDPRLDQAGPLALALHVAALCWCSRNLTDGVIGKRTARRLLDLEDPSTVAAALVDAGVWADEGDAFRLVDYLTDQPSAEQVRTDREARTKRQRAWRESTRRRSTNTSTDSTTDTSTDGAVDASVDPAPSRPGPTRPEGDGRDGDAPPSLPDDPAERAAVATRGAALARAQLASARAGVAS